MAIFSERTSGEAWRYTSTRPCRPGAAYTTTMTAAETENGRLAGRSSNALGRRSANLVSRNGRTVAGGVAPGNVNSGPHQPAGQTRRNAAPDSGWPEHPDTDYHLPQVWDDGACGGTACQRARLDPGVGPVRNRVKGSKPRPAERLGSIPQATPAGHRRKGLGGSPAKLSALKIAARVSPGPELVEASSGEAMRQRRTNDATRLGSRFAVG